MTKKKKINFQSAMFYVMSYYSTNLHTYLPIILFGKKSSAYHAGLATLAPNVGNEDRDLPMEDYK